MDNNDHDHFQSRSGVVLGVTVAMAALSTTGVFLRIISRASIVKRVAIDDYFMILAWIISSGLAAALVYGCAWGLGRHEEDVPTSWQAPQRTAIYAFTIMYQPALMALKSSILTFYLSFSKTHRLFKWACIVTWLAVLAGGLSLTLVTIFQCNPISAVFSAFPHPTASCIDIITIFLSSAPLNLITDFAILFLPMPILTGMRIPKRQKIILVITFGFGIFVTVVDVVRIAYLQSASQTRLTEIQNFNSSTSTQTANRTDFSYYVSYSFMWSVVEVDIGILCACVPGLKPLVARVMPHMLREAGEETSRRDSVISQQIGSGDMARAHRIPSMPETPMQPSVPPNVLFRDFGSIAEQGGSAPSPGRVSNYPPGRDSNPSPRVSSSSEPKEIEEGGGEMGIMDFLTTPDMNELPTHLQPMERTFTGQTNTSRHTRPETPTFFDFVNMKGKKSMVQLTFRESLFPIMMVTVLFFIWGFEYGLLDVLNQQFQRVAHMTPGQSTSIHSAYFAGYAVAPFFIGRPVLKRWGFKACYSVGLSIFSCGTLVYWPSAVLTSFSAFVITNFIVGSGLSILEVSANPFIALCGPAQYAEVRLNFSQGVQAIGSVVAPLIAQKAFFGTASSLVNTQWAYLGISLATILLAVAYHYTPLPEATDSELEDASERLDGANKARWYKWPVVYVTLAIGVFSQFCYVGGQEVNGTLFDTYLAFVGPSASGSNWLAVVHTAFAVSRFLAALLGLWIKPRILLLFYYFGAIVFTVLAMKTMGGTAIAMITMVFFFEGPIFSLIYAQSLRGMGKHTKLAAVLITMATSGGAVFSPISSHLAHKEKSPRYSLVVAVACFAAGALYPIWTNGVGKARRQVDPIKDVTASPHSSRDGSTSSRTSRALSFLSIRKKVTAQSTEAEWTERKNEDGAARNESRGGQ